MPTHKEIIKKATETYNSVKPRLCAINMMNFLIKVTAYFVVLTLQFLCVQWFGNAFITGFQAAIFWVLYVAVFLFVHIPIDTGAKVCYSNIVMGKKVRTDNIFAFFKNIKQTHECRLSAAIKIALVVIAWYAVSKLCGSVLSASGVASMSGVGTFVSVTIIVLALICVSAIMISHSPVTYLMAKTPKARAWKIKKSAHKLSRNHRADILLLYLRNWNKFLLCIITLGIYCFWAVPYINVLNKTYIDTICD